MKQPDNYRDPGAKVTTFENLSEFQWKEEMRSGADYYHKIGAWVAIIFNPIFGLTDYYNIPESWQNVFIIRISVSLITFIGLLLYQKRIISTYLLVAIPFALISLQNSYTYSIIGPEHILGHNLNYLALFMGGSLFLLWPIGYSIIAIVGSFISTLLFVATNPNLDLSHFAVDGGVLLATGSIFTIFMIQARYRLRLREVKARIALKANLEVTEFQKREIEQRSEQLLTAARELRKAKGQIEDMNSLLQEQNTELETQVAQRTESLTKTNKEMDQLVYSLSHDFRTPMVNVKGLLQVAEHLDDVGELKTLISKMAVSMNRFDELLRDMMNYAVYWDQEIKAKPINLKDIITDTFKHFHYLHSNKMRLTLLGDAPAWRLIGDYEKMRVILYCIISNSVHYRKGTPEDALIIEASADTKGLWLKITDNGVGISPDHLPRVFEMFYRGNSKSTGAGIGLYIAKGIIERLNGDLKLESGENNGTTIQVFIPGDSGTIQ